MATQAARTHDGRPTRRQWAAPLLPLVLLLAPLVSTTTIVPPGSLDTAVHVYVVTQGHTASLVVPDGDRLVRYAYGDWQYYALANTTPTRGIAALFWPTRGTLGRQMLPRSADSQALARHIPRGVDHVHVVRVDDAAARALAARLNAMYEAHRETEVVNEPYGMRFVHHPRRYLWFWNSNHAVAGWLRELGAEIRGPAFVSRWRVQEI